MRETLRELIKRNSRKPMFELLKEGAYLSFNEDSYSRSYCENHCPYQYVEYRWDCEGNCRNWEDSLKDGQREVYGADILIGEVLRNGYQVLGISGINEPLMSDSSRPYADLYWDDAYNGEEGICAKCQYYGSAKCPEDILSEKCLRHEDVWAIENITEAVNEVLAWNM